MSKMPWIVLAALSVVMTLGASDALDHLDAVIAWRPR